MSDTEADTVTIDPVVETQARELGWAPKEDFKGDPEKWVDAKEYVERGEHVLPIVKATNRRLREDLTQQSAKVAKLEAAIRESQETVAALEEFHTADIEDRVKRARADLLNQLKAAKRDENIDREVELTDELARLNTAAVESPKRKTNGTGDTVEGAAAVDHTKNPEFMAWHEDNPWFNTDIARTRIAQGVAEQLRINGDKTLGRAFLDKVVEGTNKEISRLSGRPAPSKVEGSRGGSSAGTSSGKSYQDLPAEAKEICDKFASDSRLVGPNRRHKDQASFRKFYATDFFREI